MLARLVSKLLTSGDPPALASQNVGITDVSHSAQPKTPTFCFLFTWDVDELSPKMESANTCFLLLLFLNPTHYQFFMPDTILGSCLI